MKTSTFKTWYAVHKWTSLVCTAFMLMLCLTGLPLIFSHEIDHALGHSVEAPELSSAAQGQTVQRASLDGIVADSLARRPGDAAQFLIGDLEDPDLWFLRLGEKVDAPEASAFYTYDARTGEFLSAYPIDEGIMNIILRLHLDMFAGLPGMLFLGFMGLLLVLSLVSGAVVYGPYMRRHEFGTVRHERSRRIRWLDLHNLLGIVTLVWVLVVGFTGVVNTLSIPIFNHWQSTQLADMTAPYRDQAPLAQAASVDKAVATALAAEPDMRISFMAFPGNDFASPNHFVAYMQGMTPLTSKLLKPLLIDAQSGRLADSAEMPWYVSALLLSQPLHFGDYGGMPLKIVWALLDVLAIIVLGSGIYLWLKKRKLPLEARMPGLQTTRSEYALAKGETT